MAKPTLIHTRFSSMMLRAIVVLAGLLSIVYASPVSLTPPAATLALVHPTSNARWACDIKAYVRAPDLFPNALLQGDARLMANGSDCTDMVGWQLGLVLKERAIVRLLAEGVTLPSEPQHNKTLMEDQFNRQDDWNDVYRVGWRQPGGQDQSPYEVALQAYYSALANASLWEVHGSERIVFDLKVDLAIAEGGLGFGPARRA